MPGVSMAYCAASTALAIQQLQTEGQVPRNVCLRSQAAEDVGVQNTKSEAAFWPMPCWTMRR